MEKIVIKVPREIKIGAHPYHIAYDATLEERHKKVGFTDITNGIILIEPKMMASSKTDVLIHELLHPIDFYYCAKTLTEEQMIALATGILNILDGLGIEFDWSLIKEG